MRVAPLLRIVAAATIVLAGVHVLRARRQAGPDVVLRLRAADFGVASAAPHAAVARVGDEVREVIAVPRSVFVAEALGIPAPGPTLRIPIRIPPPFDRLDSAAFRLTLRALPVQFEISQAALHSLVGWSSTKDLDHGWHLLRDARDPGAATLEIDLDEQERGGQASARLSAVEPLPARFESRELDLPTGASIELAYGLGGNPAAEASGEVRFRASLLCRNGTRVALVDTAVRTSERSAERWHEATEPLPPSCTTGRITLESTRSPGTGSYGVWALPRFTAPRPHDADPPLNLVLVSLDTLRADHLSSYGYPRTTSPAIDVRLVARGTTFSDVSTTFPQTNVAHLSLFTSLYPGALPEPAQIDAHTKVTMLAEALRDAGFETAAFTEDALIAGALGFWFGFDRFVELTPRPEHRGWPTFALGLRYLRAHAERRFFLFLHTYKTHAPLWANPRYDGEFRDPHEWDDPHLGPHVPPQHRAEVDTYDRTIREADGLVAQVLAELERAGIADRTLVVVLSDHGEGFGEHVLLGHSFSFEQEQLHVPLVLRGPGIPAGRRIEAPVSLVDVAPTLLELLGVPPLPDAQGVSLAGALRGGRLDAERPLFFSWAGPEAAGVRFGRFKWMTAKGMNRTYDLGADPGERQPGPASNSAEKVGRGLVARQAEIDRRLREQILARGAGVDESPSLAPSVVESLRALGYL
jgi:arylsulfatase A-like enzyme